MTLSQIPPTQRSATRTLLEPSPSTRLTTETPPPQKKKKEIYLHKKGVQLLPFEPLQSKKDNFSENKLIAEERQKARF